MPPGKRAIKSKTTETYQHPEADLPMRPEVGTQAQFKKKKPPVTYRYDSSLSPELEWEGQNPAREAGEALIKEIADCGLRIAELGRARASRADSGAPPESSAERDKQIQNLKSQIANAESRLRRISGAFLNWSGKAERLSFDVPTLPLFVHERLSTKAIIETLKGHKSDKQEDFFRELWGDPQHSVTDQVLRAYEYRDDWVNRMMLGDSLVAMNSKLHYEGLGGQVQMIYIDPPYGVKLGSNFQPFIRKRDVAHNDDEDMTREPEMVQPYRDTWELDLHSYLTYLRDGMVESGRAVPLIPSLSPNGREGARRAGEGERVPAGNGHAPVAIVFGPENGEVSEKLVYEAAREAHVKGDYEESVWDHLAGSVSAPFTAGEHGQVAVKVIDQRGNELLVVKSLKQA